MLLLLKFILANAGLAYIVTMAQVAEPIRQLFKESTFIGKVLRCPLCFGTYTPLVMYPLVYRRFDLDVLYYCFIGAITAYIIYLLIIQIKTIKLF